MGLLKPSTIKPLVGTLVAPLNGLIPATWGCVVSGENDVVKPNSMPLPVRLFPDVSSTDGDRYTWNWRPTPRGCCGTKVAIVPVAATSTVAARYTPAVSSYTVKFCGVSVAGSMGLVNCATIGALVGMFEFPLCGLVRTICGLVVSVVEPVVKVLWNSGEVCPPATFVTATE